MTPDKVLDHPAKVLSDDQRRFYFEHGYLHLDGFVDSDWLDRLWAVTDRFIDDSRSRTASDDVFDLEPAHTADSPRLRRLNQPVTQDPVLEAFGLRGPVVDLAEDLLGPNVKFHHSKLNFKWADGGEEVKWHQDIQFWPHSNYSPLTIGVYMDDVDDEMGPMGVIPGSHDEDLFDLYGDDGQWVGAIHDRDLPKVRLGDAVWLKGPRGSVTVRQGARTSGPRLLMRRPIPFLFRAPLLLHLDGFVGGRLPSTGCSRHRRQHRAVQQTIIREQGSALGRCVRPGGPA